MKLILITVLLLLNVQAVFAGLTPEETAELKTLKAEFDLTIAKRQAQRVKPKLTPNQRLVLLMEYKQNELMKRQLVKSSAQSCYVTEKDTRAVVQLVEDVRKRDRVGEKARLIKAYEAGAASVQSQRVYVPQPQQLIGPSNLESLQQTQVLRGIRSELQQQNFLLQQQQYRR